MLITVSVFARKTIEFAFSDKTQPLCVVRHQAASSARCETVIILSGYLTQCNQLILNLFYSTESDHVRELDSSVGTLLNVLQLD